MISTTEIILSRFYMHETEARNAADGMKEDAGRVRNREEGRFIGVTRWGCPRGGFRIMGKS